MSQNSVVEVTQKLMQEDTLITGVDIGNKSLKISYLTEQGKVESFAIPTVIAPAPAEKTELNTASNVGVISPLSNLHVNITSKAISSKSQNYFVGEYAKDKDNRKEPGMEKENTEEKQPEKKHSNKLHISTMLTGLAVVAALNEKTNVIIPFSGGLPIDEMKEVDQDTALNAIKGTHVVKFIDGMFEGKEITITIEEGHFYGEAVISNISLSFDIKDGELVETELGEKIGVNFSLADLGGGTSDFVKYTEEGLDSILSHNLPFGTNEYIDKMMKEVAEHEGFAKVRDRLRSKNPNARPYHTREHFMSEVVEPEILKMVDDPSYEPRFIANWAFVKNVDVTDVVKEHLIAYGERMDGELLDYWTKTSTEHFVIVGGGLLFGYLVFKDLKDQYTFPPTIKDSQFFTSRGYLIANLLKLKAKQSV